MAVIRHVALGLAIAHASIDTLHTFSFGIFADSL
jgi:hypothetical protein